MVSGASALFWIHVEGRKKRCSLWGDETRFIPLVGFESVSGFCCEAANYAPSIHSNPLEARVGMKPLSVEENKEVGS